MGLDQVRARKPIRGGRGEYHSLNRRKKNTQDRELKGIGPHEDPRGSDR
jgi:hypothetical protein